MPPVLRRVARHEVSKSTMNASQRSGRKCSAVRSDGRPCTQRSINGLDEPLCATHAHPKKGGRRPKHGFYSESNLDQLEYLRRVRVEDWVQGGGLAPAEERSLQIREREMDLHPPDPALADIDVAIAALLHKMEILDALIFRAKEHELDITVLLALYLRATTRLGHLIVEREAMASSEHGDLLALLQRANEQLDGAG